MDDGNQERNILLPWEIENIHLICANSIDALVKKIGCE